MVGEGVSNRRFGSTLLFGMELRNEKEKTDKNRKWLIKTK